MEYFTDCTVLITGASSGIGREMAIQLAPYASNMVLAARRLDRLESLKMEINDSHPEVNIYPYGIDLGNEAALDTFLQWLDQSGLEIDFLINNAGLGDHGPFANGSWPRIQQMLDVNISALTRLSHFLVPEMKRQGGGAILNVSSIASLLPMPGLAVYAATKAYVTSFSEALRAELRGSDISVTALCPGPVPTEFGKQATRSGENRAFDVDSPQWLMVDAAAVAAEGLRAVARDRARIVTGFNISVLALFISLTPIFIMRFFLNARGRDLSEGSQR